MKIPRNLLILIYIMAFTCNANFSIAQIRYGPKVGLNFSELPNKTKYIIDQQLYSGYHAGIIAEVQLFDNLYLQPGILMSNKGSRYIVGNNIGGSTTGFSNFQFSAYYADIPVNLVYKFNKHSFKLYLIAGPQIGYGLSGKWTATYETSSGMHFGNGPEDDLKPFDYGINIGGGIEKGRFQISSQYYHGLRTLSTMDPQLKEQKYKGVTVSVAYLFGKEKRVYQDYEIRYLSKSKSSRSKAHRKKHSH